MMRINKTQPVVEDDIDKYKPLNEINGHAWRFVMWIEKIFLCFFNKKFKEILKQYVINL